MFLQKNLKIQCILKKINGKFLKKINGRHINSWEY